MTARTLPPCPSCGTTEDRWGHEVRGVYDGVLFWACGRCGVAWPRDFGDWARLNEASAEHAARWNDEGPEEVAR